MVAQELRIGNLVIADGLYEGKIVTVNQIGQQGTLSEDKRVILFVGFDVGEFLKDIKPIPLTEEWLLKFGFVKGNICYPSGYSINLLSTDFFLRPCAYDGWYWGFNKDEKNLDCELNDVQPINHVHQLQNLYWCLCGKELTLKKALKS